MATILEQNYQFIKGETGKYFEKDIAYSGKEKYVYKIINFEPSDEMGKIRVSKGFELVGRLPSNSKVWNMKFSKDDDGSTHLTAVSGQKIYEVNNWTDTTNFRADLVYTGLNDNFVSIIPVTEKDYSGGGSDQYVVILDGGYPLKYDYSTISNLSTNHKASLGLYVNDRLWTNDTEEQALIHWSKAGNVSDFTGVDDAGFKQLKENNNPVTAMASIFVPASNNTHVICAKKDEVHSIYGDTSDNFQQYEINIGSAGTRSPQGLYQVGQELFILHDTEIKRYTTLSQLGVLKEDSVTEDIYKYWKNEVDIPELQNGFILYDKIDKRLYFMCSTNNTGFNNHAFCYTANKGWYEREFYSTGFTCWDIDPDTGDIYVADRNGFIYKFNSGYAYADKSYICYIDYGINNFKTPYSKLGTIDSYLEIEYTAPFDLDLKLIKFNKSGEIINDFENTFVFKDKRKRYNKSNYDNSYYIENVIERKNFKLGFFDALQSKIVYNNINGVDFKINQLFLTAQRGYIS